MASPGEIHLRTCLHLPFRRGVASFIRGAVRVFVVALAVCTGIGLGMRAQASNGLREELHRSYALRSSCMVRREEKIRPDFTLPTGYSLMGVTRIRGERYAVLAATAPSSAPTYESGGGTAEEFGSDGRLILRYQASERADSQWDIVEYLRLPVANAAAGITQR
jgi:hypothetical protein